MTSRLVGLTLDARDPERLSAFWAALVGPGSAAQVALRFVHAGSAPVGPARVHLHVTSEGSTQEEVVDAALARGASHVDVGQRPDEAHVVLADPEGNAFCVIEPGNGFLAGCGPLGELACDGTRDVGVFWAEALGWPLVWDEGGETAIQSPLGGTKIAWGGEPVAPRRGPDRQRLHLAAGDLDAEVDRLTSLGAAVVARDTDGADLADPDGNAFRLVRG